MFVFFKGGGGGFKTTVEKINFKNYKIILGKSSSAQASSSGVLNLNSKKICTSTVSSKFNSKPISFYVKFSTTSPVSSKINEIVSDEGFTPNQLNQFPKLELYQKWMEEDKFRRSRHTETPTAEELTKLNLNISEKDDIKVIPAPKGSKWLTDDTNDYQSLILRPCIKTAYDIAMERRGNIILTGNPGVGKVFVFFFVFFFLYSYLPFLLMMILIIKIIF